MAKFELDGPSFGRLRWIGYALLTFSLIDNIDTLFPPQFMNPVWEVQTIGTIVERIPVPLVGFGLIFIGEYFGRRKGEKLFLAILSWLCLLLAVLFLFMVPLGIFGSLRINSQAQEQVENQVKQQLSQLGIAEQRVQQSQPAQLQVLAQQLQRSGVRIQAQSPDALRAEVLSQIAASKRQVQTQSQTLRSTQQRALLKNALKWNLGAIITSVMFFVIWKTTDWTRSSKQDLSLLQVVNPAQGQILQPVIQAPPGIQLPPSGSTVTTSGPQAPAVPQVPPPAAPQIPVLPMPPAPPNSAEADS
jgi:hypothetical protein